MDFLISFFELVSDCLDEVGLEFSDYVLENYIKPNCIFPTNVWAKEPSINKRTTNGPESFHRTFNAQFYSTHPPIYFVIEALKEMQAETNIKISTIKKNLSEAIPTKDVQKIDHVIKLYDQFKIDCNVLNFLSETGYRFQKIKRKKKETQESLSKTMNTWLSKPKVDLPLEHLDPDNHISLSISSKLVELEENQVEKLKILVDYPHNIKDPKQKENLDLVIEVPNETSKAIL
ncbi:hypothetical protein QTP88_006463 [Uroleucon formosanum]